jgi:osmotically-inducible protein OsmY
VKSDAEIREDVITELRWDPQITQPEAIGVAVRDGAVTLTGHPPTYGEKLAAEKAAERVYGVKAVASDLEVRLSGEPRDDSEIAKAIAFKREAKVDARHVSIQITDHTARLCGHVHSLKEAAAARAAAASAPGVAAVGNYLVVTP